MSREVEKLGKRIAFLEETLNSLLRNGTGLGHSSFEDGAIEQYTNGSLGSSFGTQFDGTNGVYPVTGPPPPTPVFTDNYALGDPATGVIGGLRIRWEGVFAAGDIAPMDFKQVEVFVSETNAPSLLYTFLKNVIPTARGGEVLISMPPSNGGYYVWLVARSLTGRVSGFSQVLGPLFPQKIREEDLGFSLADLQGSQLFWGSTQPTTDKIGDLWLKLPDEIAYRWEGGSLGGWVAVPDQASVVDAMKTFIGDRLSSDSDVVLSSGDAMTLVAHAQDLANAAQSSATQASTDAAAANSLATLAKSTADSKVTVYRQASMPAGGGYGLNDLWMDTDDSNKVYAWAGGAWVLSDDQRIATALSTAQGKTTIFAQISAPSTTGRTTGDLWIDTDDGNKQYVWNGAWAASTFGASAISATARQLGAFTIYKQASAPTTGVLNGDYWIDDDDGNKAYVRVAGAWVLVQDTAITTAINNAAAAQTTANSKTTVFAQISAPTTTGRTEGDIWIDIDDGNKQYRWSKISTSMRTNLALNPDATPGGADWTAFTGTGVATGALNGGSGQTGLGFYRVTWTTASTTVDGGFTTVPLSSLAVGSQYTASVQLRSSIAQTLRVGLQFLDSTGAVLSTSWGTASAAVANTWKQYSVTATVPASTVTTRVVAASTTGGVVWPVSSTLDGDRLLVEAGAAVGTYFDGSSGGDNIWTGTAANSASQSWTNTDTGTYGWQPQLIRSQSIAPQSIVAKDVIATGTVTAALLESVLVLATTIIAGNINGTHVSIKQDGVYVYSDDPSDGIPNEVIRMGTATDDFFGITDSNGLLQLSLDVTGAVNARTANFREDIIVQGRTLTSRLMDMPGGGSPGTGATTGNYWAPGSGITGVTTEIGLFEFSASLAPNRLYRFTPMLYYSRSAVATYLDAKIRDGGTAGGAPTLSSPVLAEMYDLGGPTPGYATPFSNARTINTDVSGVAGGTHRLLLTVTAGGGGTIDVLNGVNGQDPQVLVEDLGPSRTNGATINRAGGSTTPPTQQYFVDIGTTGRGSYRGNGTLRTDVSEVVQGWDPSGYNGDGYGYFAFNNMPNITGTVDQVDLYLYWDHWYYNSGGTALIAPSAYANGLSALAGTWAVPGWPKPGGVWVTVPSGWWPLFKNLQTGGVKLGPSGGTNLTYYGKASDCRLRIWYTQ